MDKYEDAEYQEEEPEVTTPNNNGCPGTKNVLSNQEIRRSQRENRGVPPDRFG